MRRKSGVCIRIRPGRKLRRSAYAAAALMMAASMASADLHSYPLEPLPQERQTLTTGAPRVSAASNAFACVEPASIANNEHGPDEHPDRCLDDAVQFWRPRLGRELSREDARQIAENVTGFFKVLLNWDAARGSETEGGSEL